MDASMPMRAKANNLDRWLPWHQRWGSTTMRKACGHRGELQLTHPAARTQTSCAGFPRNRVTRCLGWGRSPQLFLKSLAIIRKKEVRLGHKQAMQPCMCILSFRRCCTSSLELFKTYRNATLLQSSSSMRTCLLHRYAFCGRETNLWACARDFKAAAPFSWQRRARRV